jgi:hypothetical protein
LAPTSSAAGVKDVGRRSRRLTVMTHDHWDRTRDDRAAWLLR